MRVRLEDIPPEGLKIETVADPADSAVAGLEMEGPLSGSFYIRKAGDQLLVTGNVKAGVHQTCARCLRDFVWQVDEPVTLELRPAETMAGSGSDLELASDDLDVEFFRGDTLDMGHLAAEQVNLALPMKPLCSDGCRGICPVCGLDRTKGNCRCEEENIDPRWAGLKGLKEALKKDS